MIDRAIDSRLWVGRNQHDAPGETPVHPLRFRVNSSLDQRLWRLQRSPAQSWRSPAYFSSITARAINASDADVVHLHWVTDGLLSIRQIGLITKPIVWSLVDMWPFSGTEHYGDTSPTARWVQGYTRANRPEDHSGVDLDRRAWERKRRDWRRPITFAAASSWMEDCLHISALFHAAPVIRVPHVLGSAFSPDADHAAARARLQLPPDVPLILFISSGGISDARKGWDLLEAALPSVRTEFPDLEVVVLGPASPDHQSPTGVPIHWAGSVDSDARLADYYAATDITVVPSREDNMPLSAMEAQTIGRPVAAFAIGGLPDIVSHMETGYLAQAFDVADLATGIALCLNDRQRGGVWGGEAAERAQRTWSPDVVIPQLLQTYASVIKP
ncbi:MAG: glycosyltransferase [Actinomycetota bacterium]|nr:glycosyltransferase [Actinomycetota bacterium]